MSMTQNYQGALNGTNVPAELAARQDAATEVTALPQPNLPLLRKVLDHIDAHPDEWSQQWHESNTCGTTRCIAGWVNYWDHGSAYGTDLEDADESAGRLLGLTADESYSLFYGTICGDKDAEKIKVHEVASDIAARTGERL